MNKVLLCNVIIICICLIAIIPNVQAWIPPTNAFSKIHTNSGSVYAINYSMPLIIQGLGTISVTANNATHTITITSTGGGGAGTGSYNETSANNVIINSNGFNINFINGTGNPINVVNSNGGNQVNVTISAGSGSGVTLDTIQCIGIYGQCLYFGNNTNTNFEFKNILGLQGIAVTGNNSNVMIATNFKINNQTCSTGFYMSSFDNKTGNHTCTSVSFSSGTAFKSNDISCGAGNFMQSFNNQTGTYTCAADSGGTITTASNIGTGGFGFFKQVSGTGLQFRNLTTTRSDLYTITQDTNNVNLGSSFKSDSITCTNQFISAFNNATGLYTCGTVTGFLTSLNGDTTAAQNIVRGKNGNVTITNSTGKVTINTGWDIPLLSGLNNFTGTNTVTENSASGWNIAIAGTGASVAPINTMTRLDGTLSAPTAVSSGDRLGTLNWRGYDGSALTASTNSITAFAEEAFTSSAHGTSLRFGTTPIGSTSSAEHLRINPYGGIRIMEIADPTATNNDLWFSTTTSNTIKYQDGGKLFSLSPQMRNNFTSPGNVTGTSSASLVMSGGYATLIPLYSTNATITATGYIYNSVAGDGCKFDIRQKTTNMGVAGTAVSGTKIGSNVQIVSSTAQANQTLSKTVVTSSLSAGTKYYFDISYARVTGGYCKILNLDWAIKEQ